MTDQPQPAPFTLTLLRAGARPAMRDAKHLIDRSDGEVSREAAIADLRGASRAMCQALEHILDHLVPDEIHRKLPDDSELHEEYAVTGAPGFPDPVYPRPATLEAARRWASHHNYDPTLRQTVQPIIRRRLVSDWEPVE